jgi:hypothetical protein
LAKPIPPARGEGSRGNDGRPRAAAVESFQKSVNKNRQWQVARTTAREAE